MSRPRLVGRAVLTSLTVLALSMGGLSTAASAATAGPVTDGPVTTTATDPTAYTNVERISDDDGSDPAATQAALDAWTPEAMQSAISMDTAPVTSGNTGSATRQDEQPTNTPVISASSWLAQPAPAATAPSTDPGAPTGPVDNASADASPADTSTGTAQPQAQPMANDWPTNGLPSVGALFFNVGPIHERCTGTVINTGTGNIIATAGHCIWNRMASWLPPTPMPNPVFVPGYHNGQAPYGKWSVKSRYIATAWKKNLHPDYDYGFIVLNKSNGRRIQDVVGANGWRTNAGYSNWVEITGYPDNRDQPLQCFAWTRQANNWMWQLIFPCDNFHTGVSGSLLLENYGRQIPQLGVAVASLGGYQQGGNSDNTSYAVLWNGNTAALINAAVRGQ
ncbi:hypothetical protein [Kitasatospora sp. NPDC097643]|uniref:trypsin-like serine peptidase n=1 Tax=Kitasatospora sp. NPDC097643 TaxID=3157230 RepID=UPI00332A4659